MVKKADKKISLKKKAKKKAKTVTAFHAEMKDGTSLVGIGNLRVVITREAGQWYAQGLEIDYLAQGSSAQDVKRQFEDGLCSTIHEHLRKFKSIGKLLEPAPGAVWKELFYDKLASLKEYSQISSHCLTENMPDAAKSFPFEQIQYIETALQAA